MRIIIAGASGLIGSALMHYLESQGHTVSPSKRGETALEGFDVLINLSGESIGTRWTKLKKEAIKQSRVETTRRLSEAAAALEKPLQAVLNASAIGYYGDRGEESVNEESPPGKGFLPEVTEEWEKALEPARQVGVRCVSLRFGIVLSPDGGALPRMLTPFKWGFGGVVGTGKQFMSWIAMEDLVRAIDHLINTKDIEGPVNLVAPKPVRNVEFTHTLGKILKKPTLFPLPEIMVKMLFGQMGQELLLSSTKVEPKKLLTSGFSFSYPTLEQALKHQLGVT